jgi:hypothetical protein
VQLLVSRLLVIGGEPGVPARLVVVAVDAGLVVLVMALCGRLTGDAGTALARREAVAALLTVLWLAVPLPWNGHPAETAVPVLWAYGVALIRRGRDLAAVAALALGIAIAPWAVLGVPCLLAAPGWRRAVRAEVLAVALGVACYLPFVLTGHFAMFEVRWKVSGGTLAALAGLGHVTWWLRLVQGAVVAAGVALAARRYRARRIGIAVVPLVAALLRVATDPQTFPYYWISVAVLTLLLVAMLPAATAPWRRVTAGGTGYLALLSEAANWTVPGSLACLGLLLILSAETSETAATFPGAATTR